MTKPQQNKIIYRTLNGVLLLNKDLGSSSNRALQQVRRLFRAAKAGHTGSLDPLATGVLPVCFGDATKFAGYLLDSDKEYVVTAQLGVVTSTGDREGEIISQLEVPAISDLEMQQVVTSFLGASKQIPSMFSALKHNGQPLYKLARQGIEIERKARDIIIYSISIEKFAGDLLTLRVKCSKGTYIRNLVEDIGAKIGCGAHVTELQRTEAGLFKIENSYSFEQLLEMQTAGVDLDALVQPITTLLTNLPHVELSEIDAAFVSNGRAIVKPVGLLMGDYCLLNSNKQFLGVGSALEDNTIAPKRMCSSAGLII